MAIIKAISSHAPINTVIDYVTKKEKTNEKLVTGINCEVSTAKEEMQATKELYGKTGGRTYKHFVQSFAPDEKIDYQTAHEIATKLVESTSCFNGYEVLVATHQDRNHIHSHLVVNSVSFEDGKKFQMSSKDLQYIKDISDGLCKEYGLSICEKGYSFDGAKRQSLVAWTKEKYQYLKSVISGEKENSYLHNIKNAVSDSMLKATDVDEFKKELETHGVTVKWKDTRKNITYIDSDGKKVRDTSLKKTFNLNADKESLLKQFEENREKQRNISITDYQKRCIISQYKITAYRDVQDVLSNNIKSQKQVVENIHNKMNRAEKSIFNIQEDIKKWTKELESCSKMQISKKHDLQEKIEHGNALIETIVDDRDKFISNYNFSSVEDVGNMQKNIEEAEAFAEKIELHIETEETLLKSYLDTDCKWELLEEQTIISARNELKDFFGNDYNEATLQKSLDDVVTVECESREMDELGVTMK